MAILHNYNLSNVGVRNFFACIRSDYGAITQKTDVEKTELEKETECENLQRNEVILPIDTYT